MMLRTVTHSTTASATVLSFNLCTFVLSYYFPFTRQKYRMVKLSILAAAFGLFCTLVTAHPGHDPEVEALERRAFLQSLSVRSLDHCAAKLKARGIDQKMKGRRKSLAQDLRKKKGHNKGEVKSALSGDIH
jgi:hypothetical protein